MNKKRVDKSPSGSATKTADLTWQFYLADDFRIEVGRKVTAIGLYPDQKVLVNMPDDASNPTTTAPAAIESLSILVSVTGLAGTFRSRLELIAPNGKPILRAPEHDIEFNRDSESVNLISRFRPLLIPEFGKYQLLIVIDKYQHTFEFELTRGRLPSE